MTHPTLKWGLLSTADINNALFPAFKISKRNELAAVASRTQEKVDAYARKWNISRALGSYDALLADPEINVIYNPLPNSLHAEWSIKALRAGKHVLCEKPIAMTVGELDAMNAASRESGRLLSEAFMYRHHPQTLKVKEIVDSGLLGILQIVKGAFSFILTREGDIRFDKALGGGSIWDVGCYPISYTRMIVGAEPLEVFGSQITSQGVDATFIGEMHFPNDIYAQFSCGFQSPSHSYIEIVGTEGILNVPLPFKPGLKGKISITRNGKMETTAIKGQDLYLGEVEDMADAILLGKSPRVNLTDSRGNTATIQALLESARIKKPIAL